MTQSADLERTRASYDQTPYVTAPAIRFQPSRMAANAAWLGLDAADAATARVLEIGCASGGHILPLAAMHPKARFLGVDLSPVQIQAGERMRAALDLPNVVLRAQSFTELGPDDGVFDYIVCHGVYSWIPESLRDSLFAVIRERLAPEGVAMVSFNALPGWRLVQMARDAMNAHAGAETDPAARVKQARELFALLSEHAAMPSVFGAYWRNQAQSTFVGDDSYLTHEIFADFNDPETFDTFNARLDAHGLGYLTESAVCGDVEQTLAPGAAAIIRTLAQGDSRARQRYIDIFGGRPFREALIVHVGRLDGRIRAPRREALDELNFVSASDAELRPNPEGTGYVFGPPDSGERIEGEAVVAALQKLVARLPESARLDDLAPSHGENREVVRDALIRLMAAGALDIATLPTGCASTLAAMPKAAPVAAAYARIGADVVNRRHELVTLPPIQRLLLPLLDGEHTKDDLVALLMRLAAEGKLTARGPDGPLSEEAAIRAHLEPMVDQCLRAFLNNALLAEA